MILRLAEVERFEDRHRGIFDVWDGFYGRSVKPTLREVRDIIALGLVGGGLTDAEADAVLADLGLADALKLYAVAQALVGVAFLPDVAHDEDAEDAEAEDAAEDAKKKSGA